MFKPKLQVLHVLLSLFGLLSFNLIQLAFESVHLHLLFLNELSFSLLDFLLSGLLVFLVFFSLQVISLEFEFMCLCIFLLSRHFKLDLP